MPKAPTKFKMGDKSTQSPSKKEEKTFSINLWAVGFFLLAVGIVAGATVKGFGVYQSWKANWDVVVFAKDNPEMVRTMKSQYDTGLEELKLEITSPKE